MSGVFRRCGLGLLWALAVPMALADEKPVQPCPGLEAVSVQTRHTAAVALSCDGARDAIGFLAPLRLGGARPVLIELVNRMPADLRRDAVGCYAPRTHRLMVLELPGFLARERWFGIPASPTLYRSVVAHEVAHALVGCHLAGRQLVNAAHEYVAYVAMFATMEPATLRAVLAAMPGEGFRFDGEINDMRYTFDPMSFGIESCRHWLRQPDGPGFLRQVIDGEVVPEMLLTRSLRSAGPSTQAGGGAPAAAASGERP